MSLQFSKQAVTLQPKTHGLLSSTLAAPRGDASSGRDAPSAASSGERGASLSSGYGDSGGAHPFSVTNVVDTILRAARADPAAAGMDLPGDSTHYSLLVAEDDGQVDPDFPEIDGSVPITTVGIDKFVLCHAGGSESPVLRVVIPASSLALRAFEVQQQGASMGMSMHGAGGAGAGSASAVAAVGGGAGGGSSDAGEGEGGEGTGKPASLTVTCYPVGAAGTRSFTVTIPP